MVGDRASGSRALAGAPVKGAQHIQKALRPDDGRLQRTERSRAALAKAVLDDIVRHGDFQPKLSVILLQARTYRVGVTRYFGARRLLLNHLARTAPAAVVDAIGLEPATRAALSDRDVKAIAWAVLAGRRFERV
jgi:hypothetical protein